MKKTYTLILIATFLAINSFSQTITYQWANDMSSYGFRLDKESGGNIIALNEYNSINTRSGWDLSK